MIILLTELGSIHALFSLIIESHVLKTLSDGVDEAGIDEFFKNNLNKLGNRSLFSNHHLYKSKLRKEFEFLSILILKFL